MVNFWQALPSPFLVLAPMEDVTDFVFREIVATKLPRPAVFFTEFTSSDGLVSKGFEKVATKLRFSENQRPIVAQLWGNNPEKLFEASKIVQDLGFDGIDLNMGCPERSLVRKGCCAGLIGNETLVSELIDSAKRGASNIPVSVKTRIGISKIVTEEWATFLLKQKIQALTVHGRIAKQMSNGSASWEEIGKAVKIRNLIAPETFIIGNGDVKSREEALFKCAEFGTDGVMIARGIFHDPWVFANEQTIHSKEEKMKVMMEQVRLFVETWGKTKNFEIVKKFVKMYVKDFDEAAQIRQEIMEAKNLEEVELVVKNAAAVTPRFEN